MKRQSTKDFQVNETILYDIIRVDIYQTLVKIHGMYNTKSEPYVNKIWTLGDDVFDLVSLIVTKASLWLGMLIMGEIVHA